MRIILSHLLIACVLPYYAFAQGANQYPLAPEEPVVNTYFGQEIPDEYQWMENPEDARLSPWLDLQYKITDKTSRQQARKQDFQAQLFSLYRNTNRHVRSGLVENKKLEREWKNQYFFSKKYIRYDKSPNLSYSERYNGSYKQLIKAKDIQLADEYIDYDRMLVDSTSNNVAVTISRNSTDQRYTYFYNLNTGEKLADELDFSINTDNLFWYNGGVIYSRRKTPTPGREREEKTRGQAIYYHKMGTPQSADKLLYSNADTSGFRSLNIWPSASDQLGDESIYLIHNYNVRGKWYKAFAKVEISPDLDFVIKDLLVINSDAEYKFNIVGSRGDSVLIHTNYNAPNFKAVWAQAGVRNKLSPFIPEYDMPLMQVNKLGKDKIAAIYRKDGIYTVLVYGLEGNLIRKLEFPVGKHLSRFYENNDKATHTIFYLSSYFHPDLKFQLDLNTLDFEPVEQVQVPYAVNDYETRYVTYTSKDGTEVPMYITCRKDIKLDGNNPVLIYGYGGFGLSVMPNYDEAQTLWLLHGGVLAVPNVRGGGAQGEEWALSGRRLQKQNGIDDFIAAAEYLIQQNYTNPKRLAIKGGSHGGMMVGAVITQRPGLFKAAIAEAGLYDMLRAENYGYKYYDELGTVTDSADFDNLYSYSPYHNVKAGIAYPNTLLITGDSDDRVPPLHSYKFLAKLQKMGDPNNLYQLYVVKGGGHSGSVNKYDNYDEHIFKYYWLFDQLEVKFY